jgi:hypothetical protein
LYVCETNVALRGYTPAGDPLPRRSPPAGRRPAPQVFFGFQVSWLCRGFHPYIQSVLFLSLFQNKKISFKKKQEETGHYLAGI